MTEKIRNAYQTLELPIGANLTQVQKARRELMKVWHPDFVAHNPDLQRQAEERSKQINNAYDILERYLIDGEIPRPRSSTQSRKQKSEQRTNQQETDAEDAHSSQTHEEEDLAVKIGAKIGILAAKISGIIRIIFAIIFGGIVGCIGGYLIIFILFRPIDWMIEAVSGWSLLDNLDRSVEPVGDGYFIFTVFAILVSFIVTFFGRIIDTILAKRQNRPFIGIHEGWFAYTTIGVSCGMIDGMVCGLLVAIISNEGISTSIAVVIGAAWGARQDCRWYVRRYLKRKK